MKKIISLVLILVFCITLCACGGDKLSPKERLPDEVAKYISTNFRLSINNTVSEAVDVDIVSIIDSADINSTDNEWVVLGTYTIKIDHEVLSAKFGLVATYDERTDEFTYSNVEFDDFE